MSSGCAPTTSTRVASTRPTLPGTSQVPRSAGGGAEAARRGRRRDARAGREPGVPPALDHERVRRGEVDAVRLVQVARRAPGDARVAVLPDDAVGPRVDDDHPVVVVVVAEQVDAARDLLAQRRLVELPRSARRAVAPEEATLAVELHDLAGIGV